jgi:hypothetical protein
MDIAETNKEGASGGCSRWLARAMMKMEINKDAF